MRTFYLFIGAIFFLASCRTDGENELVAPIKSFFDLPTDYRPIQEGSVATGRLKSEVHGGQLSGEWRYNRQGKLAEWRHYRFGQLSTVDQYRYDVVGGLRYVQHFDDGCGYSSLSTCSGPVTWTSYSEITIDNAGRIQESRSFLKQSGQWELRSTSTYEYDSQNRPVKVIRQYEYNASRSTATQEFGYDSEDNIVTLREINTNASPDRTFTYNYDQGLNPYAGMKHYVSPFYSSRNLQATPGATYEYNATGYPTRIQQNNVVTELTYY